MTDTLELSPVEAPAPTRRARLRAFIVLGLVVAAILALLAQGLLRSLNYFETVDQAIAQRASLGTKVIRLEGLVRGPIVRDALGARFELAGSKGVVAVDEVGNPPQLFQLNIPVVVVGHFDSATAQVFHASQIMVKHTANYIAAHPGRVRAPNGSVR